MDPEMPLHSCKFLADAKHAQWLCSSCSENINLNFDTTLRRVMRREGWTACEIQAVEPVRRFAKRTMAELAPDPTMSTNPQRRAFQFNCIYELQARIDATRGLHHARAAEKEDSMEERERGAREGLSDSAAPSLAPTDLTAKATSSSPPDSHSGPCLRKHENDPDIQQWACPHCLSALDDDFDGILFEGMLREGWNHDEINALGPLRRFSERSWDQLKPDLTLADELQSRQWSQGLLWELQARIDGVRAIKEARDDEKDEKDEKREKSSLETKGKL
ncbi:hypothetical protein A1O3_09767 [Capronia epimyces CBS 606.96]|uniref:Uncharacterized protein n=1 Tax=Capronia epimyces CBS 606.96 TaxID=1182542 RepID=W9XJL4_9EURO|nr:uncharacterized protein A1O3_09767 [Capronia epimyces CBS 606.96]EXJ77540.1 hypothetical protein A1O3_09767 [Capronia epimyces CBS 606.96]